MRRALGAAAIVAALVALQAPPAVATSPSPCPSPSAASDARTGCPTAPVDPNQAAYEALKSRLGGDIANALGAQQRLSATLDRFAGIEVSLNAQVTRQELIITSLEAEIARLDTEIASTQARIEVEKQQLATMSREIYREPASLFILIARSGNLHEALVVTADAVVAGQRAHALQDKLQADLNRLQTARTKRQADLDRENNTRDLLVANLNSLQEVIAQQDSVNGQLQGLVVQLTTAKNHLQNQPPDVTNTLAQLLESQEQDLILRSYQTAWMQAQVGTGLAMVNHALPAGKTISGLKLAWPMVAGSFTITQGFGPTSFALEPSLGPYKHFHTGVDLAASPGNPVFSAADGVVVAVGRGAFGYGTYVVVAHGGGVATLYGHLRGTNASVGQQVRRGQLIGLEGSTGYSTGPHLHFELRVFDQVTDPMPYLPIPGTTLNG